MTTASVQVDENIPETDDELAAPLRPIAVFYKKMAARSAIKPNVARMRITALKAFAAVLDADESKQPEDILQQVDDLSRRWAIKHNGSGETAHTYATRVRGALTDYLAYQADPTGFKFKMREVVASDRKKTPKPPRVVSDGDAVETEELPVGRRAVRDFPLPEGREFSFRLPADFTMVDAARIAVHLMTLAGDYNPFNQSPTQALTSIIKAPSNGSHHD